MSRRLVTLLLLVVALVLALAAYGYFEATRDPVVVRYRVGFANWPAGQPPLRLVQLTDLHVSAPDMPAARAARIVAQVNALRPDIVVLTGDYWGGKLWDTEPRQFALAVEALGKLRAPLGVFASRGNHDEALWAPILFARTPATLLVNRWVDAGPLVVAGVDDLMGKPSPWAAIKDAPPGKPLILIGHEPDFFAWPLPPRIDLFIAGHTHGGQVKLPLFGAKPLSPFLDAHLRGSFVENGRRMIVSSGIGTSVVPLRIGVPPEVVEVTLGPAHSVGRNSGTDR